MPTDPEFWSLVFLQGITLAVLLIAWAGLLIPVFPGLLVMWLASLAYALIQQAAGRMNWLDWVLFALITLLAAGGGILDNIILARQMRGHEIPWRSILLALSVGLVASIFFTPLIGILASPLSLFLVETRRLHSRRKGLESAKLYMIASGWSYAAIFGVGGLIVAAWMLWAFL
ncbi:MAG TPA: DUF456 family protein [Anaerolineales bacterium]|nr:DUF456 family protein [Anaerolineales bacterium]